MAIPGDARFGQWADPSFGASLNSPGSGGGGGVMPTVLSKPDAPIGASASDNAWSPSASNNPSGYDPTPGHQAYQDYGAYQKANPGTTATALGNGKTSIGSRPWGENEIDPFTGNLGWKDNYYDLMSHSMAEGGEVPGDQDTGDAIPADNDPFSLISSALSYGRQKFQMPNKLFGEPVQPVTGYAAGGEVDGDGDDDGDPVQDQQGQQSQGVIPDQGAAPAQDQQPQAQQGQGQQLNPQAAMAYLKGAGAAPPQAADMMERRVDPHNALDPTERRMKAVTATGTPDKAFSLLQHYRQKFNAYSAFADSALQGAGGRPPNVEAAADALNKAYSFVPDGTSVRFSPHQGGMRVAVHKIIPSKPAGPGGDQPTQNPFPTLSPSQPTAPPFGKRTAQNDQDDDQPQTFAEGGEVQDEPDDTFGAGDAAQAPPGDDPNAGVLPSQSDQQADQGPVQKALGGRRPDQAIKDFVVGLPQLLGIGQKAGFDASLDKGGFDAAAVEHLQPPQEQAAPAPDNTSRKAQDPAVARMNASPMTGGQSPRAVGQEVAKQAAEAEDTPQSVMKQISKMIDQQFPAVSQSAQNAEAKKAALETYLKGLQSIQGEQVKGANSLDRARVQGGFKLQDTDMKVKGKHEDVNTQQTHGDVRADNKFKTQRDIADANRTSREEIAAAGRDAAMGRTIVTNKPGTLNSPEAFQKAQQAVGGQQQAPRQQAPQQSQQEFPPAPQDPSQRVAGKVYKSPTGKVGRWTGQGWQVLQ